MNQKGISSILIIVGVLVLGGVSYGAYYWWQKQNETASWQTYRNEEYGFEVEYPEEWEVLIAKTEDSIFTTFYFKDFKSGSPQNEYLMISISIGPNSKGLIIDEWLTIETNKKPVYQKTGEAIVGGQKALILNTSPAVSGSGSTYIFGNEKRNFIYAVSYFSATEKIFNQILSTFKFTK